MRIRTNISPISPVISVEKPTKLIEPPTKPAQMCGENAPVSR